MNERVEYVGEWWVPGGNSAPWSGRLVFDPLAGITLEVAGSGPGLIFPVDPFEIPIMHGFTIDGHRVTLVHCAQTGSVTHLPGGYAATYSASFAFVDAHFDSPQAIAFDELQLRISDVGEWLGFSGFSFSSSTPDGFTIDYEVPDDIALAVAPPLVIDVTFNALRATGPERSYTTRTLEVVQEEWLRLKSDSALPWSTLVETTRQIRNFFCFVFRHRADIVELRGWATLSDPVHEGETARQEVIVMYRQNAVFEARGSTVQLREMLFTLPDGATGSDSPLSRWLAQVELLGPIYDLFLVSLFQPRIFLELQFISLAQALESLHSRKFPDYELPRAEFRQRVRDVVSAAPEKLKHWLKDKLANSNKASFRQGFANLIETLPANLRSALGDEEALGRKVHVTRNYLTHWNADLEAEAAKGEELIRLTTGLQVILEALLLLELGFDREQVERLIERNEHYKRNVNFAIRKPGLIARNDGAPVTANQTEQ